MDERRAEILSSILYLCVYIIVKFLQQGFHTVPHSILIDKVGKGALEEWTVRQIENWLNSRSQRVFIGDTESNWRPVTSGDPQGSILRPVLFDLPINGWDEGTDPPQQVHW